VTAHVHDWQPAYQLGRGFYTCACGRGARKTLRRGAPPKWHVYTPEGWKLKLEEIQSRDNRLDREQRENMHARDLADEEVG